MARSLPVRLRFWLLLAGPPLLTGQTCAPAPAGLASRALADTTFQWIPRRVEGFRVYFLADSYPAQRQDSLLARLGPAVANAQRLIGASSLGAPIDLFFIETRDQMTRLIGGRATGFAQPSARAVFLVTNPTWRAFERHEIMHVVAGQAWGDAAPNMDWLVEGLAQAADGRCAGRPNAEVLLALTSRHGWIPLDAMLTAFRRQSDLRAYLQAAAFVEYLLGRVGVPALRDLWANGATADTPVGGTSLGALAEEWRAQLQSSWTPTAAQIAFIESDGCG
jgi:hypothetical protein